MSTQAGYRETANQPLFVVTGAAGFLGSTLVRQLVNRGSAVRAIVRSEPGPALAGVACEIRFADIRNPEQLVQHFRGEPGQPVIVIHAAGVVSIASKVRREVFQTNVEGTSNVLAACRAAGVRRLVYVSSVHALAEQPHGTSVIEADSFDPHRVHGEYAKTKAEATRRVLLATGQDVVVVLPSGLVGPGDYGGGNFTQMLRQVVTGVLPATVPGGYDFADVRDVAAGCIAAAEKGTAGQCYLLTGSYHRATEMVREAARLSGRRWARPELPSWVVRILAPLMEFTASVWKVPPIFTPYSLHVLTTNSAFSHERASRELGYQTRPWSDTLRDTVEWLQERGQTRRMPFTLQVVRSVVAPLTRTRLFRWIAPKAMPPVEWALKTISGGRVQLSGLLVPSLVLHSVGAKSGLERATELMYTPDGHGRAIVAGTSFAQVRHPGWTYNLMANPDAHIVVRGNRMPVHATLIGDAEREDAWQRIEAQWPGYRSYERESGRTVRLFRLRPVRAVSGDAKSALS